MNAHLDRAIGSLVGLAVGDALGTTLECSTLYTLEAAIWSVARSDGFADAVLLAANLGHDADTVAAVTGQLAGALWGLSGIPERWVAKLAWADDIKARAEKLVQLGAV